MDDLDLRVILGSLFHDLIPKNRGHEHIACECCAVFRFMASLKATVTIWPDFDFHRTPAVPSRSGMPSAVTPRSFPPKYRPPISSRMSRISMPSPTTSFLVVKSGSCPWAADTKNLRRCSAFFHWEQCSSLWALFNGNLFRLFMA